MLPTKKTFYLQQVLIEHYYIFHHDHYYHVNSKLLMKNCDLDGSNRVRKVFSNCYLKHNLNNIIHLKLGNSGIALWKLYDQDYYLMLTSFEYDLPNLKFVTSFIRCHITIETDTTERGNQQDLLLSSDYDDKLVIIFSC